MPDVKILHRGVFVFFTQDLSKYKDQQEQKKSKMNHPPIQVLQVLGGDQYQDASDIFAYFLQITAKMLDLIENPDASSDQV